MKNLEQIRAANALKHKDKKIGGKEGGEVVKKLSPMIRENGLLSTLAFALEKKSETEMKNVGHFEVFQFIVEHLRHQSVKWPAWNFQNPLDLAEYLVSDKASSEELRAITSETVEYLNYLRRFVRKDNNGNDNED